MLQKLQVGKINDAIANIWYAQDRSSVVHVTAFFGSAVSKTLYNVRKRYILPLADSPSLILPPLRRQLAGEGFVEDGGFAGFTAGEDGLGFARGLVQPGKQAFDSLDDTALF